MINFRSFYNCLQLLTTTLGLKEKFGHQALNAKNRGIIGIWIVSLVGVVGIVIVGGAALILILTDNPLLYFDIENAIKESPAYLDSNKLRDAQIQGDFLGTVILPDGSYAPYEVVSGVIERVPDNPLLTKYSKEVKIKFLSGDYSIGQFNDNIVSPFFLRNRTATAGIISDHMSTIVRLSNGQLLPIKILKGEVKEGIVNGLIEAQTYTTGHLIVAELKNNKIVSAGVSLGTEKLSEADTIISQSALGLYSELEVEERAEVLGASTKSQDVLAASDSLATNGVRPVFDEELGT